MKNNFLKLINFVNRTVVIVNGFLFTLISFVTLITGIAPDKFIGMWLLFLSGLILLFPFRLFKSEKNLRRYFILLSIATGGIILGYFLNEETFKSGVTILQLVLLLCFILNVYFVRLYLSFRHNPKNVNPFLEKKAIKRLVAIFLIPVVLIILIGLYLFMDIRDTPEGRNYISIPSPLPFVQANFTKEAIDSGYELESGTYVNNKGLSVEISTKTNTDNDFIELYENDKKVFRVDFNETGIIKTTAYSINGLEFSKDRVGFGRDGNGNIVFLENLEIFTALDAFDWIIHPSRNFKGGISIKFDKSMKYPPHKSILPFRRGKQIWNITLKDSKNTIPLISDILIWY